MLAVHIVVHNGLEHVRACLESVLERTSCPFHIRLWDNASDQETARYLHAIGKRAEVSRFRSSRNIGFGEPHNRLVRKANEDYVCILNSDVVVPHDWQLLPLSLLDADPNVAAAGPLVAGFHTRGESEYVEGCCLFMRLADARNYGPFDPKTFPFAYCEDSDLSYRLRHAGRRLAHAPIPGLRHAGQVTTRRLMRDGVDVYGFIVANQQRLRHRWPGVPPPKQLVVHRAGMHGDLICLTPTLRALRRKYPDRPLVLSTAYPEVLIGNPDIATFVHWTSDRANLDLDHATELPYPPHHLIDAFALAAGVELDDRQPRLYLSPAERGFATQLPRCFIALLGDAGWRAKRWPSWSELRRRLRAELDVPVVQLGTQEPAERDDRWDLRGRTTLREALAVIERASLCVSADTALLHAAGALGVPALGVYGPTDPQYYLHPGQEALASDLNCLGCYHHQPRPRGAVVTCPRELIVEPRSPGQPTRCMEEVPPGAVLERIIARWPNC